MTRGIKHGRLLLALLTWILTTGMFSMPGHTMAANPLACDSQAQVMMFSACDPAVKVGMAACCLPSSCPGLMMTSPGLLSGVVSVASEPPVSLAFSLPDSPSERLYRPPRL